MKAIDFIERFNRYCPESLAEEGDPVGLHIGTLNKEVQRIMMKIGRAHV